MGLNLKKCLTAFSAAILGCATLLAANIRGTVTDDNGEPLIEATVRLLAAKDSAFVKGTTTDINGKFTLRDIKSGSYIIQTSYIGYDNATVNTKVGDSNVNVAPLKMKESSIMLKEAVVKGVKTEIVAKEDTLEYNAGSYKTQPNAVMEDLLKKLPGVEVDSDGKIKAGGKEVTKILVDGKEFFSDDPKVASKNLPANMIDKLQVVDRKSDLARLTGVDDGEEETVINLTVKKGMKNGWFGVVNGGYGTDDRYAADFNVNRFWNDNQITFLGNFNNINQLGFTDSNGSRFRRFGGNNGINTSQSFGVNFNVGKSDESFRVGGDLLYSHTDQDTRTAQERQYLFTDSTSYVSSGSKSRDKGHNIRGDFRVKWKKDTLTTLEFRPRFSLNYNRSTSADSSRTYAGDLARSLVTRSINTGRSKGNSYEFGGELWLNHKFASRPGRSFSVAIDYRMSNVREDDFSYSYNRFYLLKNVLGNDSIDTYDQYTDNHIWSNRVGARLTWTEPIGNVKNGRFIEISYRMNYRWNNADKLVYDHPVDYPDGGYDPVVDYMQSILNDELSNRFRNDFFTQRFQVGFRQVRKDYTLNAGVAFVPSMSKSKDLINSQRNIDTRWVFNVAPYLRFRYKFSKTRNMNVDYRGNANEPSISQLQPVADMSNPLRIVIGNPELKPSFNHNVRVRFSDFNVEAQRSIMMMANVGMTQNSIVSNTQFNRETGGQITTYENVNGNWNANMFGMISLPFRNKNWQFNGNLFARYSQAIGFNNGERSRSNSFNIGPSVSLAFRPENWEFELRPYFNLQQTTNSLQSASNRSVQTYGGMFNFGWYAPFGLVVNSDLSYTGTSGYSAGFDQNQWMWNASIAYQFLKGKEATVAIKGYDLLQQRKSVMRNITANTIDDTSYNSLTRYFMISFSYRFNTFGSGNQPADRNAHRGPGAPGGRPPRF